MKIRKGTKNKRIQRKRLRILAFSLAGIVILSAIGFLYASHNDSEKEVKDVKEVEVIEEKEDPLKEEKNDLNIDAAAALSIYIDNEKEEIFYEKNADETLPIASITKIMTAIIVAENYVLDDQIGEEGQEIVMRDKTNEFRVWSQTPIREILYPLLIESNNNAANVLSTVSNRYLNRGGDSKSNFVKEMNSKGSEIGLDKTNFINPSGLDGETEVNYSTAEDIAKLAEYTLYQTGLFDILSLREHRLYSPSGNLYYLSVNTNDLLSRGGGGWRERIVGGKTGWTYNARGCLLLVVKNPTGEGYIINVILGAEDRFGEMERLVNFVHETYF